VVQLLKYIQSNSNINKLKACRVSSPKWPQLCLVGIVKLYALCCQNMEVIYIHKFTSAPLLSLHFGTQSNMCTLFITKLHAFEIPLHSESKFGNYLRIWKYTKVVMRGILVIVGVTVKCRWVASQNIFQFAIRQVTSFRRGNNHKSILARIHPFSRCSMHVHTQSINQPYNLFKWLMSMSIMDLYSTETFLMCR